MDQNRRSFMKTGALAAAAALVAADPRSVMGQDKSPEAQPIPLKAQRKPTFRFTAETFKPYIGDIFQAPNALGAMVSLTLVDVSEFEMNEDLKLMTKSPRKSESFTLTFNSSEALPKFTSIHKMRHPALGRFDLFLSVHQNEGGTYVYRATFGRLSS